MENEKKNDITRNQIPDPFDLPSGLLGFMVTGYLSLALMGAVYFSHSDPRDRDQGVTQRSGLVETNRPSLYKPSATNLSTRVQTNLH